ncbi:MAG: hypothetical protein U1E83_09240 [Methylotetracoccus sp.]
MGLLITLVALLTVVWAVFRVMAELRVRRITTAELELVVFGVPMEYLQFIGLRRASVVRFRELVERKDLASLCREWPKLEKDFRAAEHEAGHRGRPLIMDYMLNHPAYIRELRRRKAVA